MKLFLTLTGIFLFIISSSLKAKEYKSKAVCSIESKEETEAAEITASSFPRPRKPCPSGPGKK